MNFKTLRHECIMMQNTLRHFAGPSRAVSTVYTKLDEATMWCGAMLNELFPGENPYANNDGTRKTVNDIILRFDDTKQIFDVGATGRTPIECVDFLREFIKLRIDEVADFELHDIRGDVDNYIRDIAVNNIMTKLIETRMWLGMLLGELRDASLEQSNGGS